MNMKVDNNLTVIILTHIDQAIVENDKSIFQVLGNPEPTLRKTYFSEDKFVKTSLLRVRD